MIYKKIFALLIAILTSMFRVEETPIEFDVYATPQPTADPIVIDDFEIISQEMLVSDCGGVRLRGPEDLIKVYQSLYGVADCNKK